MTKKLKYGKDIPPVKWIREHPELDSAKGFVRDDLDYIHFWLNYNTYDICILEFKCRQADMTKTEKMNANIIDSALRYAYQENKHRPLTNSGKQTIDYYGYFLVQHERETPEDGRTWINYEQVSLQEYVDFLKFKWAPEGNILIG